VENPQGEKGFPTSMTIHRPEYFSSLKERWQRRISFKYLISAHRLSVARVRTRSTVPDLILGFCKELHDSLCRFDDDDSRDDVTIRMKI
jgi:hypothetical protein